MKYLKLVLLILFFVSKVLAQSDSRKINMDTSFFKIENGELVRCARREAEGFNIPTAFNPNLHSYQIRFLHAETIMAEYDVYDKKYQNNKTHVSSTFEVKNGKFEEWYIGGEKRISSFYSEDKLNGDFKVFYQNGNLKRLEKWKDGEWKEGECFDESGNKIAYCSYQEVAEFIGGLSEMYNFIGGNLKYPKIARQNGIEGVVYVQFVVDTDGSITEVSIVKGVEKSLDDEALRIVSAMPKWKPGKLEGNLVRTKFTLPVRFKM